MGRRALSYLLIFSFAQFITSCDTADCTVNNTVNLSIAFYASDTKEAVHIGDTLNITTEGSDSLLLNKGINLKSVKLPMSYWQEADTLKLEFHNAESDTRHNVTLYVDKTNTPHYEAPDCPTTMFHQIQSVTFTSPTNYVDSIEVVNSAVNYNDQENIRIYLHTAS